MKLNADLVGTLLKNYQTKINWRETTNYAATIQDNNPKYFDDRQKDGIVSHRRVSNLELCYKLQDLIFHINYR